jgi:hypothetical protein
MVGPTGTGRGSGVTLNETTVLRSSPTSAMSCAYDTVRSIDWRIKPSGTAARGENPLETPRAKRLSVSVV